MFYAGSLSGVSDFYLALHQSQKYGCEELYNRFSIVDYEWMQYTGLKDKNGKEIYEGDILSRKDWGFGGYHEDEEKYIVKPLEYYLDSGEEEYHFRVHLWSEYCEVIGNIYENPELTKASE
jgi:uncharacterized phage protein (TIGR01671 family)